MPPKKTNPSSKLSFPAKDLKKSNPNEKLYEKHKIRFDLSILKKPLYPPSEKPMPVYEPHIYKIPHIPKNDQNLHLRLVSARLKNRSQKVHDYCEEELFSILAYSFILEEEKSDSSFKTSRKNRIIREKFRKGELKSPSFRKTTIKLSNSFHEFKTPIYPIHSIDICHYISSRSSSLWEDLSEFFHVNITDNHLEDQNPYLNKLLDSFQNEASPIVNPYIPYFKVNLPFIIPVIGISGITTICQLLSLLYDFEILVINNPETELKRKFDNMEEQKEDNSTKIFLKKTTIIQESDDKSIVNSICHYINNHSQTGIVIQGFPQTKSQLALLEKSLSNIDTVSSRSNRIGSSSTTPRTPGSSYSKSRYPLMPGIIFSTYVDNDIQEGSSNSYKLIDPETGFVYKKGFNMPSILDLHEIEPIHFRNQINIINSRLKSYPSSVSNDIQSSKSISAIQSLESICKKKYVTIIIQKASNVSEILKKLDVFMTNLFQQAGKDSGMPENAFQSLLTPNELLKPMFAYRALLSWRKCLEIFAKPIADQNNIISTLSEKKNRLIKAANERFGLLISRHDKREEISKVNELSSVQKNPRFKKETNEKKEKDRADFFNKIWDEAVMIRNNNFKDINTIIQKSGLIELILEIRKAPQITFLSMIQKMVYIQWFYDTFVLKRDDNSELALADDFFKSLEINPVDVPIFDFLIHSDPNKKSASRDQIPHLELSKIVITPNPKNINTFREPPPEIASPIIKPSLSQIPRTGRRRLRLSNEIITSNEEQPQKRKSRGLSLLMLKQKNTENNYEFLSVENIGSSSFDLLKERMPFLKTIETHPIFFDSSSVCNILNISLYQSNVPFSNIQKYAEDFFGFLTNEFQNDCLQEEIHVSHNTFRRFYVNAHQKENHLVSAISELEHNLKNIVKSKYTNEMEIFSANFRAHKKPFVHHDTSFLPENVRNLANTSLNFDEPFICQNMVNFNVILKIASHANKFSNCGDFLQLLINLGISEEIQNRLILCLKIMECQECFSTENFLKAFASNQDEIDQLQEYLK